MIQQSVLNSSGSFKFDSKDYKDIYREGFVDFVFKSVNDLRYLFFSNRVFFTDVRTPFETYSFNIITIKAFCLLDNLKNKKI